MIVLKTEGKHWGNSEHFEQVLWNMRRLIFWPIPSRIVRRTTMPVSARSLKFRIIWAQNLESSELKLWEERASRTHCGVPRIQTAMICSEKEFWRSPNWYFPFSWRFLNDCFTRQLSFVWCFLVNRCNGTSKVLHLEFMNTLYHETNLLEKFSKIGNRIMKRFAEDRNRAWKWWYLQNTQKSTSATILIFVNLCGAVGDSRKPPNRKVLRDRTQPKPSGLSSKKRSMSTVLARCFNATCPCLDTHSATFRIFWVTNWLISVGFAENSPETKAR